MQKNYGFLGRLALLGTALIWGSSFFIFKSTLNSIGTLWLLTIRFSASTILLFAVCWRNVLKMDKRSLLGAVYMGLSLTAAYILQTYGLVYTTASKNAFLTASYCMLVPFLVWIVYRKRPGINTLIASVLCLTGIGLVSLENGFGKVNIGDVLTLSCGVFYALQIILVEHYVEQYDALSLSTVQFGVAGVICFILAFLFEPLPQSIPMDACFSLAYLSVVSTALCYLLQAWGLRYTPSATATVLMSLEAVFGVIFAAMFGGEHITTNAMFGFALIFVSELLNELGAKFFEPKSKRLT